MKFSQSKKEKMREIRLKRIRKEYGYMVGTRISENQKVVDQAVIFNVIYILVDDGKYYSIYQILKENILGEHLFFKF